MATSTAAKLGKAPVHGWPFPLTVHTTLRQQVIYNCPLFPGPCTPTPLFLAVAVVVVVVVVVDFAFELPVQPCIPEAAEELEVAATSSMTALPPATPLGGWEGEGTALGPDALRYIWAAPPCGSSQANFDEITVSSWRTALGKSPRLLFHQPHPQGVGGGEGTALGPDALRYIWAAPPWTPRMPWPT